jgi:lipopolysaccharide transport system ATP-binding protein
MSAPHLRFEHVWKAYPRWDGQTRTLKGHVARRLPVFNRDHRWALEDISFELLRGESVGLIGANGAGKSTLLRLASGVGVATRGSIALADNTASVLTLGDAFDLTLTGRENAITAGLMQGLRRAAVVEKLPAILEWAELEPFADAPVQSYSDGMRLRLAFGVIAQLEPDVLLLDEVISVGDLRFQEKCMQRVAELRARGTTVLYASHALEEVAEVCDRAIWLERGRLRAFDRASDVIERYREAMHAESVRRTPPSEGPDALGLELGRNRIGSQEVTIERVALAGVEGGPGRVSSGEPFSVSFDVVPRGRVGGAARSSVAIVRAEDRLVCVDLNTEADRVALELDSASSVRLELPALSLAPGDYEVEIGVYAEDWSYVYDFHSEVYALTVTGASGGGVYRPRSGWAVEQAPGSAGAR